MLKAISIWSLPGAWCAAGELLATFRRVKALGFEGLELAFDPDGAIGLRSTAEEMRAVRRAADDAGLAITSLATGAFWRDHFAMDDAAARARARLLEHQSDEVYFPHVVRLMGLQDQLGGEPAQAAITAARRYYERMEAQLEGREFLAGPFTFADIAFYMAALFGERQGAPLTGDTPRLLDWRQRMTARPAVRAVVGPMAAWLHNAGRPVPAFMRGID